MFEDDKSEGVNCDNKKCPFFDMTGIFEQKCSKGGNNDNSLLPECEGYIPEQVGRLVRPLIWHYWPEDRKIPDDIPLGELLLVEIKYRKEDSGPEIKSARFTKNSSGSIFGVVGDAFWYDRKIIRWASIQHLI